MRLPAIAIVTPLERDFLAICAHSSIADEHILLVETSSVERTVENPANRETSYDLSNKCGSCVAYSSGVDNTRYLQV